jgi:hypothetical protein
MYMHTCLLRATFNIDSIPQVTFFVDPWELYRMVVETLLIAIFRPEERVDTYRC